jgi:hypothetical protein
MPSQQHKRPGVLSCLDNDDAAESAGVVYVWHLSADAQQRLKDARLRLLRNLALVLWELKAHTCVGTAREELLTGHSRLWTSLDALVMKQRQLGQPKHV